MISEREIFERLMKGENLDDIMNEITASVNGALEAKKKAEAEAEEAKRKAEAETKARKDAAMFNLDAIINGLCGLLVVYGYTDEAVELAKLDEEDKEDFRSLAKVAKDNPSDLVVLFQQTPTGNEDDPHNLPELGEKPDNGAITALLEAGLNLLEKLVDVLESARDSLYIKRTQILYYISSYFIKMHIAKY